MIIDLLLYQNFFNNEGVKNFAERFTDKRKLSLSNVQEKAILFAIKFTVTPGLYCYLDILCQCKERDQLNWKYCPGPDRMGCVDKTNYLANMAF
jgi:hypothetical protein